MRQINALRSLPRSLQNCFHGNGGGREAGGGTDEAGTLLHFSFIFTSVISLRCDTGTLETGARARPGLIVAVAHLFNFHFLFLCFQLLLATSLSEWLRRAGRFLMKRWRELWSLQVAA